jgi:adenylosuccinate synthase
VDGLVVTCLDQLPQDVLVCTVYFIDGKPWTPEPPTVPDLAYQEWLTNQLFKCVPKYDSIKRSDLLDFIAGHLGAPVAIASKGPTWQDKVTLSQMTGAAR